MTRTSGCYGLLLPAVDAGVGQPSCHSKLALAGYPHPSGDLCVTQRINHAHCQMQSIGSLEHALDQPLVDQLKTLLM